MKTPGLSAALLLAFSGMAQAQGIRDLSMTPAEMLQQNLHVNPSGAAQQGTSLPPGLPGSATWPKPGGGQAPVTGAPLPADSYMAGYCAPDFRPLIARSGRYAGMAACLQQQREQACQLYARMPADARGALDNAIHCLARRSEAMDHGDEAEEEDSGWNFAGLGGRKKAPVSMAGCAGGDTQRLAMIQRYWDDQNTVYALVFLPDLVMDSSGSCLNQR